MPTDAAARLHLIAAEMRAAGDRGNLLALRRGLRAAPASLIPAVRTAALRDLPKRGGLNEYEASQKIRVAVLTGARTANVRLVGKASRATDTGTWRHPDPSMRGYDRSYQKWVQQTYAPAAGWWTTTLRTRSPLVTPLILGELHAVETRIAAT